MKNDDYRKIWMNDQESMRSVALSHNESRFLKLLKIEPNTFNEISKSLNISTQSTVQLSSQLIKKGYIDTASMPKPGLHNRGKRNVICFVLREF